MDEKPDEDRFYRMLREDDLLRAAIERMTNIKIVFVEDLPRAEAPNENEEEDNEQPGN